MCNSIFIGKKTIPKAEDGEEFELTVKGIYTTEDGVRKLDILEVDGDRVLPADRYEKSDCGCKDKHEGPMDAEDALEIFFLTPKKK